MSDRRIEPLRFEASEIVPVAQATEVFDAAATIVAMTQLFGEKHFVGRCERHNIVWDAVIGGCGLCADLAADDESRRDAIVYAMHERGWPQATLLGTSDKARAYAEFDRVLSLHGAATMIRHEDGRLEVVDPAKWELRPTAACEAEDARFLEIASPRDAGLGMAEDTVSEHKSAMRASFAGAWAKSLEAAGIAGRAEDAGEAWLKGALEDEAAGLVAMKPAKPEPKPEPGYPWPKRFFED